MSKNYKLGKPKKAPAWLLALRKRLHKDFGHCVNTCNKCKKHARAKQKMVDSFCFSCVACRVGLALNMLEDAYGIGDREMVFKKKYKTLKSLKSLRKKK